MRISCLRVLLIIIAAAMTPIPAVALVGPVADLSITKVPDKADYFVGDLITWTIDIHNAGPSDIGFTVVDPWVSGLQIQSAFIPAGAGGGVATVDLSGITVTRNLLLSGQDYSFFLTYSALTPGFFSNTATVTSAAFDPDMSNNSATSGIQVRATVPEPGSLALLGLGLAGLVASRKRKPQ